jgi:hypothetical protein
MVNNPDVKLTRETYEKNFNVVGFWNTFFLNNPKLFMDGAAFIMDEYLLYRLFSTSLNVSNCIIYAGYHHTRYYMKVLDALGFRRKNSALEIKKDKQCLNIKTFDFFDKDYNEGPPGIIYQVSDSKRRRLSSPLKPNLIRRRRAKTLNRRKYRKM